MSDLPVSSKISRANERDARLLAHLGFGSYRRDRLSTIGQAAVFRIYEETLPQRFTRSCIVKIANENESLEREALIAQSLHAELKLQTPRVERSGTFESISFIQYEDSGLSEVRWTSQNEREIAKLAAEIHNLPQGLADRWGGGISHTPSLASIVEQVGALHAAEELQHALLHVHIPSKDVEEVLLLRSKAMQWDLELLAGPHVLCHGDLHRGNVLCGPSIISASPEEGSARQFAVIDWEFAHVDLVWFDLFQWLDATSPDQPLYRYGDRIALLTRYYRLSRCRRKGVSLREFLCGYLAYAALHLLWIVLRVESDLTEGRFSAAVLQRQQLENAQILLSIKRDMDPIDGKMTLARQRLREK